MVKDPNSMFFLLLVAGLSLSALSRSMVVVNPDTPEAKKLKSW